MHIKNKFRVKNPKIIYGIGLNRKKRKELKEEYIKNFKKKMIEDNKCFINPQVQVKL